MNKITIYTDGSCLGNPGPGGWGAIIMEGGKNIELKGNHPDTTNNRMEMTAILEALKWIQENNHTDREIELFSDSNLIIQTLNKGWKKNANTDIWAGIDKNRAWLNIKWTWVKAHADNKYNNMVDEIAFNEATNAKKTAGIK